MQKLHSLLAEYQKSHRNRTNVKIHTICVPIIVFSLFGLLSALPYFSWELALAVGGLFYYFKLESKIFPVMLMYILINLSLVYFLRNQLGAKWLEFNVTLFVLAWVGQFVGHKIEGVKPSFLEDLQFFLIAPIWVLKKFKLV